ncbi:MAG: hypothetical protein WCA36_08665 [Pseudolabrys sp.]|jgi:hypothetical protein
MVRRPDGISMHFVTSHFVASYDGIGDDSLHTYGGQLRLSPTLN